MKKETRFTNGLLKDFNPEELMNKIYERKESLHTVREHDGKYYTIFIFGHDIFMKLDETARWDVDIIMEDAEGNQTRLDLGDKFRKLTKKQVIDKLNRWVRKTTKEGDKKTMKTYEIKTNEQYNSNEVYFDKKPSAEVRENLKGLRMRWNHKKACWYGFATAEEITKAIEGKVTKAVKKTTTPKVVARKAVVVNDLPSKKNKYGVKVGDVFVSSWGYDQTNLTFVQVVDLVGEQSVRVREVYPPVKSQKGISFMSRDVAFKVTGEMLPVSENSVFIKDNKKGDVKRLKDGYNGGCRIKLDSFAIARPYHGETLYESWYA